MRIYKEFFFDAAHFLPYAADGHPNRRMHGHSFRVVVWLAGKPAAETGLVRHFEDVEREVMAVRERLDRALEKPLPEIARVEVHRASCREGCVYDGPDSE